MRQDPLEQIANFSKDELDAFGYAVKLLVGYGATEMEANKVVLSMINKIKKKQSQRDIGKQTMN